MKTGKNIINIAILVITIMATGCTSVFELTGVEGEKELKGHQWDHYHKFGVKLYSEGRYEDAIICFEFALENGFPDQWKARTHGAHFIEEYYPTFMSGQCCLKLRRFEEAEEFFMKFTTMKTRGKPMAAVQVQAEQLAQICKEQIK